MQARQFLTQHAKRTQKLRDEVFDDLLAIAEDYSPVNVEMVKALKSFSEGSKEVRGALITLGYRCGGQKINGEILKAAVAADIIHSAALIADDIMDQSNLRRGRLAMHKFYEEKIARKYLTNDPKHFGYSMAFNLSLTAIFYAEKIFTNVALDVERVKKAQYLMNSYLVDTTFGQGIDVARQGNLTTSEEDILLIHKLKTALYTISGPLTVGGVLGGVTEKQIAAMNEFGDKVGVAFQLRDDELGLFGSQEEIGKPVDSDLKEGKNTLLFVKAFANANTKQRKILKDAFGNSNVTEKQLEKVREVVEATGARQLSWQMAQELVVKGKEFVPQITTDAKLQETLYNLADFMVKRQR